MRRHVTGMVLKGVFIIRRPTPPATSDTIQAESGVDLTTEGGQTIKKET